MELYRNLEGNSGVAAYEIAPHAIRVRFMTGCEYEYTYASAGRDAVETMKRLAVAGRGLSSYVSRTRPPYARKWTAASAAL